MLNYPLAKCTADPKTILGFRNAYTESNANIHEIHGSFEYIFYIFNIMSDKNQCQTNIKPGREILLNTGFIDYSTIFKLASSPEERESLIKKGVEDAKKT